jgi:hypothetical protein
VRSSGEGRSASGALIAELAVSAVEGLGAAVGQGGRIGPRPAVRGRLIDKYEGVACLSQALSEPGVVEDHYGPPGLTGYPVAPGGHALVG